MLQPLLASDERKVVVSLSLDPKLIDATIKVVRTSAD